MKKLLFAVLTIVLIGACNSPQKMSGTGNDSSGMMNRTDTGSMSRPDSTR